MTMKFFTRKIFIILIVLLSSAELAYASVFSDVSRDHKNYEAIAAMSEKKIVTGYDDGSFRPDNSVTRAEFCVIIARAAGYKKNSGTFNKALPFNDVSKDYWAEDYIKYAYNAGIVNGMGDGSFLPAGSVTYEQAIKMLICFIGLEQEAKKAGGSKWYSGYLETAYQKGLLDRVDVIVTGKASRSDIVQLLYNAYNKDLVPESDKQNTGNIPQTENGSVNTDQAEDDKKENTVVHKEIKKILIDAGHNYDGFDKGARAEEEAIKEEIITWEISDKLVKKLEEYGFEVYVTRENKDSSIGNTSVSDSLKARVDMANKLNVDLFISIHCNTGGGTGVETYCFKKESVGGVISKMICKSISDDTELYNRGVKTAEYYVIKNTVMPSVLIETGFIDSENDAKILTNSSGQEKIADAIAGAILEYNKIYKSLNKNTEGINNIDD